MAPLRTHAQIGVTDTDTELIRRTWQSLRRSFVHPKRECLIPHKEVSSLPGDPYPTQEGPIPPKKALSLPERPGSSFEHPSYCTCFNTALDHDSTRHPQIIPCFEVSILNGQQ